MLNNLPSPYIRKLEKQQSGGVLLRSINNYLQTNISTKPISIYCHIPFCKERCLSCNIDAFALRKEDFLAVKEYARVLTKEIKLWGRIASLGNRPVTTIHFGGGTPSCLPMEFMNEILKSLKENFTINEKTEIAIEVTINNLNNLYRNFFKTSSIKRLHLKIQSLNDIIRREMNCKYTSKEILKIISDTLEEGFNLSINLIYGLPGQMQLDLISDINKLTEIGVQGLSLSEFEALNQNSEDLENLKEYEKNIDLRYFMFKKGSDELINKGFKQNYCKYSACEYV